jgi:hypothetical protein
MTASVENRAPAIGGTMNGTRFFVSLIATTTPGSSAMRERGTA